jgi:hypothetical protein
MNKLTTAERAKIIKCLVEGCSLRATQRMTGFAKKTVARLQVEIGQACDAYSDKIMRNLPCKVIQVDEVWTFTYCKQGNIPERFQGDESIGDTWTWIAIDADTKLTGSWSNSEQLTVTLTQPRCAMRSVKCLLTTGD